jgi:hypothetical protein
MRLVGRVVILAITPLVWSALDHRKALDEVDRKVANCP